MVEVSETGSEAPELAKRLLKATSKVSGKRRKRVKDELSEGFNKGVILLRHIPRGFYEKEMFDFFSQFGEVTRLKLFRSKKTGGSKHFAFIEFQFEDVAKIAAETMDFYLMFQHVLRCHFVPQSEVRKSTFNNWQRRYNPPNTRKINIRAYNKTLTDPEKIRERHIRINKEKRKLQNKLNSLGIDYDVFDIKHNESFIPPRRPRASPEDMYQLHTRKRIDPADDRCSDFEYSDEEDWGIEEKEELETRKFDNKIIRQNVGASDPQRNDSFNVMVVDPNDSEITFKSPPVSARIKRKPMKRVDQVDNSYAGIETDPSIFKEKVKRKRQRMLLNLQKCLDSDEEECAGEEDSTSKEAVRTPKIGKRVKKRISVNVK